MIDLWYFSYFMQKTGLCKGNAKAKRNWGLAFYFIFFKGYIFTLSTRNT